MVRVNLGDEPRPAQRYHADSIQGLTMRLLEGIRVLDFGRFIAGPYCAALLADHGADVIRVERVGGGEDRYLPPVADTGEGGMFMQLNRNKRCLTLDIACTEGRAIVQRLVRQADVVVANLPPSTLRQLGLDYETLAALNPRIVVVVATAYGSKGPYSAQAGFDSVGQAMSGAMYMSGHPGAPVRTGVNYVDFHTAQACAMGAMAALWARERSGRGQLVEGSLLRSALIQSNSLLIEQAVRAPNRIPQGNRGYMAGPVDVFATQDGHIVVQAVGQAMFERWCRAVERADMIDDPRFADDVQRGANSAAMSEVMAGWCANKTRAQVLAALAAAKIPAGPVYSPQQALEDAHIQAAGLLQPCAFDGLAQGFPLAVHPVDLSDLPTGVYRPPPALGQHSDEILRELGYDDATIADLHARAIV